MAQELRVKLTLDNRDFKTKLAESQCALAAGLQPVGAINLASSFGALFANFKAAANYAALARTQMESGKDSIFLRWASNVAQFNMALSAAGKGFGVLFRPNAPVNLAREQFERAKSLAVGTTVRDIGATVLSRRGLLPDLGERLREAESKLSGAQGRVAVRINALRQKTGIQDASMDFWKDDPRMNKVISALDKAQKAVEKLRNEYQSATESVKRLADAHAKLEAFSKTLRVKVDAGQISAKDARSQLLEARKNLGAESAVSVPSRMLGGLLVGLRGLGSALLTVGSLVGAIISGIAGLLSSIWHVISTVVSAVISAVRSMVSFVVNSVETGIKTIAGLAAIVGTTLALGLKKAVDEARTSVNAMAQTGMPIKSGAILQRMAEMAGLSGEHIATQLNRMQRAFSGVNVEAIKTMNALRALGLDINALRMMSPENQLRAIADGLQMIKDPADRAAAVIEIFSVRGSQMISMLEQFKALSAEAALQWGKSADLLKEHAAAFAFVSRAVEGISTKIKAFFIGMASGMADNLVSLADKLNHLDFTELGERLGRYITVVVNKLRPMWAEFQAAFAKLGGFSHGVMPGMVNIFKALFGTQFFRTLGEGFVAAFAKLGDMLMTVVRAAAMAFHELFADKPTLEAIGEMLVAACKEAVAAFLEAFHDILPDIAEGLNRIFAPIIAAILHPIAYKQTVEAREKLSAAEEGMEIQKKEMAFWEPSMNSPTAGPAIQKYAAGKYAEAFNEYNRLKEFADMQRGIIKEWDDRINGMIISARQTAAAWARPENIDRLKGEAETAMAEAGPKLKAGLQAIFDRVMDALESGKLDSNFFKSKEKWEQFKKDWNALASLLPKLPKIPDLPKSGGEGEPIEPAWPMQKRLFAAGNRLETVGIFTRAIAENMGMFRVSPSNAAPYAPNTPRSFMGIGLQSAEGMASAGLTAMRDPSMQMNRMVNFLGKIDARLNSTLRVAVENGMPGRAG